MMKGLLGCLIKILVVVILLLLLGLLILKCSGESCIKKIDKTLPSVSEASWEITTPTHLYYAEEGEKKRNGDVIMTNWWEKAGGKWVYYEDTVLLEKRLYGDIGLRKREESPSS